MPNDAGRVSDDLVIPPPRPQRAMMIKNLMPRLPERGHIKIGALGEKRTSRSGGEYALPKKLDHFLVTTLERGADGNFVVDRDFHERHGDKPTEIPVRLLYDDVTLNAPSRYACYIGRTLWCSGDGEVATRISAKPGNPALPEPFQAACPCHRQDPGYTGNDKCKMNLSLSVLIDGAGGVGGVWKFRTTSYNSITGLLSSMAFLRSVTGGILANIPFHLRIQPKQAVNPSDQSPVLIYVVSLEFAGDIAELQRMGHQIALDRATTHVSIANIEAEAKRLLMLPGPPNSVLPGDDADAIVEEFYPEQAADPDAAPPRPKRGDFIAAAPEPETAADTFLVVNADGEEIECADEDATERTLIGIFDEAANRSRAVLDGVGESNANAIAALSQDAAGRLRSHWRDLAAALRNVEEAERPTEQTPAPNVMALEPLPRDDTWWSANELLIRSSGKDFLAEMHQRCREARTESEVACLRDHNGPAIDALPKADKEQVLGWLVDREKAVRVPA